MSEPAVHQKTLRQRDLVLFTVSAILLLDTLAAGASVGASSIFWWVFLGIVFFIPFAMICAELGCTYPEQGGIYAWIRDAYGGRWASRATWCYWVNTAVWMPAIYILFAGIFKQMFYPEMSLMWQIAIGVALSWVAVWVNVLTLDVGKWVPNLGAVLKVVVFLVVIFGAVSYTQTHGMANPLNLESLTPSWNEGLQYIPVIIYGMLGFELISSSSEEMKNPARDVPRAVFLSGLIIILLYLFGTMAILAAIPVGDINLVEGLVDTLRLFYGGSEIGQWFVIALGVATMFTFFSNAVTWSLGCNRSAAEAAMEGELPAVFAMHHKTRGTPVGAAVLMGVVSTVTICLYGFLSGSNEDLFWSLFAFSAVIFLLPYQGMLLAYIKLRVIDTERHRPYRVPGGLLTAKLCATVCMFILGVSTFLFMYTPGEGWQMPVVLGVACLLVIGELVIRSAELPKEV
ncbi:MAG: APC family permease [Pseudomonadales bacterium]